MSTTAHASQEKVSLRRQVQEVLRTQDARSMQGSLGRLVGGAAWCLIAGFVFATVLTLATWLWMEEPPLGFLGWVLVYLAVMVPLLVLMELRSRKEYKVEPLTGAGDEVKIEHAPSQLGPLVQFATWGPRNLIDGLAGTRRRWRPHQNVVFRRASKMLLELAKYQGGVELKFLVHAPEDMRVFDQAVEWLDRHDWVGKSSNGEKLWISTDGIKRLEALDLMPGRSVKVV